MDDKTRQYVKFQIHKHSRTCRKKGKALCRFGIPFLPFPNTVILEPYKDESKEQIHVKLFNKIKLTLDEMKDGSDITFDKFLEQMRSFQDITQRCT